MVEIKIEKNGVRATVVTRVLEEITLQGKALRSITREVLQFELIEGKIWVTSLEAVSELDQSQGFQL